MSAYYRSVLFYSMLIEGCVVDYWIIGGEEVATEMRSRHVPVVYGSKEAIEAFYKR